MATPSSPSALEDALRSNLGSLRKIYFRPDRVVRRGDFADHQETVLLLHGLAQTRNVWEVMEDRLRYDGFGVFSFDLGGLLQRERNRSADRLARALSRKVERVCGRYGLERFHVVGHGTGGLIARDYVCDHGGETRVRSLITLATPHHGTPTALIAWFVLSGGLARGRLLDRLPGAAGGDGWPAGSFPPGIPLVSIYSRADLLVPPPCARLRPNDDQNSVRNVPLADLGHTELTHDPGVYHIVRNQLIAAARLWREREGRPIPEFLRDRRW